MNLKVISSVLLTALLLSVSTITAQETRDKGKEDSPRIINIVNFIRQTDYRLENSDALMLETVEKQIDLVNRYNFPATFLFQYDALINPAYQKLMKSKLRPECELGAWWEITQPHVEAAGIKWRGEHSWVSTANIAFTPGYTLREREQLVDVYMDKFKEIYGKYPVSVGSWYIDSHTLEYMYKKYGIVASCNCKDQVGTDGYTLWGGYWNQAYYPSKKNAYMPAQTEEGQIHVPIFRMLGSDPMYQYDAGVGTAYQSVISLEPVYKEAGKDKKWVEYFLESIVNQPCLAFNYAQAGQENSFTWAGMGEGLEMQFPIFDSLRKPGKIRIETLEESGRWFKKNFAQTPATAITTLSDVRNEGNKSVWYNSRYYRSNLYWEKDGFCFRDIHFFNEDFQSEYLNTPGKTGQFFYYTLPVVDRFYWSTPEEKTGLRVVKTDKAGNKSVLVLTDPVVCEPSSTVLRVSSKDKNGNNFIFTFHEDKIDVTCEAVEKDLDWALELKVPGERIDRLPFKQFSNSSVSSEFRGFAYPIACEEGNIVKGNNTDYVLRFVPAANKLVIDCTPGEQSATACVTEKEFDIDLWPNGLPNTNGIDRTPFDDNVQNYKPSLRVYLPPKEIATGRVVIACPGGAYGGLAYNHEGYDWAPFYNQLGIAYAVLKYRMPRGNKDVPFSDAEEAIRLMKEKAKDWHINPDDVGIMGSSAGGHLASTVATHIKPTLRPAFQVLFYPVITMDKSFTHLDSRTNLLGKKISRKLEDLYSNEKQVTNETPRAFIAFSDDDDGVPSINGVYYYLALKENKIPASLYIYPSGGHGWGYNKDFKYHKEMIQDLRAWLLSF